ncbi:MAG: cytochrome b/b6 domain-containing protein [Paracoccaceae bacterium]
MTDPRNGVVVELPLRRIRPVIVREMVWDPLVRLFHWSLAISFAANLFVIDPESKLHRSIGYAVLGLVAVRIFWGFVGPRHARFVDFPPSASGVAKQVGDLLRGSRTVHAGHSPLGALMIYNLLIGVLLVAISGWMMTTARWFGYEWVENLHELFVRWTEISVLIHIAGVAFESRRSRVNLPKAMVTGYKDLPAHKQGDSGNG